MRFRLTTPILSFLCGCFSATIYAQPIQVRPQQTVDFQLCFYYENAPGNPPAAYQSDKASPFL